MERRRLGADGPLVSALGYGAMSFTDFYGPTTEEESHAVLRACLDLGIDHVDTSNVYGMGRSETVIGNFLAAHGKDAFTLATKAGIKRDPETGARSFDNSREHLEAELDGSLKRLGVERVALFYVHRREADRPIEEVTETLAGFVKAGKIGAFGFSEIAPSSLRRAAAVHPVAAVQSEYSLATRAPELGLVQACAELGTALVAFSPVGRAMLTDTPPTPERVAESAFLKANPRFQSPHFEANLKIVEGFRAVAKRLGRSAAETAIAWLMTRGPHVIPIPGTRSPEHLRQCVDGAARPLTAEEIAEVEAVLPVGWAHGDRYSEAQWKGPERFS
jgi:aryl-alcohol dehydrogenase-like predicted oxidoreductase